MEKVFCSNCIYSLKIYDIHSGCNKILKKSVRNEYNNDLIEPAVKINDRENINGECPHYEPTFLVWLIDKITGRRK